MFSYDKKARLMLMFNFMETLFALSLGITFLLMLLLIYHFKQRLCAIEQKHDVLMEIINTLVQETHLLKSVVASVCNRRVPTQQMPAAPPTQDVDEDVDNDDDDDDDDDKEEEIEDDEDDDSSFCIKEVIDEEILVQHLVDREGVDREGGDLLQNLVDREGGDDLLQNLVDREGGDLLQELLEEPDVDDAAAAPEFEIAELVVVADEAAILVDTEVPPTEIKSELIVESPLQSVLPTTTPGDETTTETLDKTTLSASDEELSKLPKFALRDLAVQRGLVAATEATKLKKPELIEILLQK